MITDTQLADLIEAVKDEAGRFPSTDMIHVELAAVRELKELRVKLATLKARLAEAGAVLRAARPLVSSNRYSNFIAERIDAILGATVSAPAARAGEEKP